MNYLILASDPSKIDPIKIAIVLGIMLVVAIVFGFLIMVVSKKFAVEVDEREEKITGCLAGANCGGCGHAGCGGLAKALVDGKGQIDDCPVTSKDQKMQIAEILGIEYAGGGDSKIVVKCGGGDNAVTKNDYVGVSDCVHQNMVVGGSKQCKTACLGLGTCAVKCKVGAIKVKDGVAYVDQKLCIKCGACLRACPKSIIEKIDGRAKVYVACSTKCRGKEVMDACKVGCIGCGLCAKNCPSCAITMVDNLPVIDYDKCTACGKCVEKCPKNVIKTLD